MEKIENLNSNNKEESPTRSILSTNKNKKRITETISETTTAEIQNQKRFSNINNINNNLSSIETNQLTQLKNLKI